MAVRDDFAAGEVLAAADLNDTFASKLPYSYGTATPSTTDSGFLWYDSNSTPAAPKFWDGSAFQPVAVGGLELITAEAFSAVSSVSINGCFTADYENYRIVAQGTTSTNAYISLRFRVSGADSSASYYTGGSFITYSTAGASAASVNNGSQAYIGYGQTGEWYSSQDIIRPFAAADTGHVGLSSQTTIGAFYCGYHNVATSYDGLTIFPASGTFTGNIRVYGYKD